MQGFKYLVAAADLLMALFIFCGAVSEYKKGKQITLFAIFIFLFLANAFAIMR